MTAASLVSPAGEPVSAELDGSDVTLRDVPLPVTIRLARPLSDEELFAFCAANEGLEIESDADGSITVMTPGGSDTSRLNQILGAELLVWARKMGNGVVFGPDLGVRFADTTLRAPDAAWLSNERWKSACGRAKKRKGFLPICPEFVAELRSPSDRASKVEAKMEFWMARGAHLGWLIDPERKLAMIYRPDREPETLLRPEFLEGEGPISGFRLAMQDFWA
ncbi:MAG TPA: Uma2 family endonuclease [Terracidiphilus sp.]|nr:Uma2 family endonuclease [Terracidiphilus sp.]